VKTKAVIAIMLCLVAMRAWPQGNSDTNAASKILALESIWNQAEEKGDARALDLIFDASMVYIDEDGSLLTKSQFLARVKVVGPQLQSLVTHTISVHVYGDTAVIAGTYHAKGMEKGKTYQRGGRFIDTWVLTKGAWLCVAAQSTPVMH
jgi:hypothetical protein